MLRLKWAICPFKTDHLLNMPKLVHKNSRVKAKLKNQFSEKVVKMYLRDLKCL